MKRLRRLEASLERLANAPIRLARRVAAIPCALPLKDSRQVDDTRHLCARLVGKAHEINVLGLYRNR